MIYWHRVSKMFYENSCFWRILNKSIGIYFHSKYKLSSHLKHNIMQKNHLEIIFHDIKICFFFRNCWNQKNLVPGRFQKIKKIKIWKFFASNYVNMSNILAISFEKVKAHYFCPFSIIVSLDRRTSASENR